MESEKFFFNREISQNPESQENREKEVYLSEIHLETKDKLQKYLPDFYRDIPTKLNYQDKAEDLKINFHFENENLNINIKTPEDLSSKTAEDLKKSEGDFLVFQNVAEGKTISKKTQDFFFLLHEYAHGINQALFKEYRPDIVQISEAKRKEFEETDEARKKELRKEERNSIIPALGESFPISIERIVTEKILQDETIDNQEKANAKKFWENHEKSLSENKLEDNPKSKFSEFDEAMICYKIYQKFGEIGILDFIKNFDFEKLSEIKKYFDLKQKVLSEEYKKILEMSAEEIMKEFAVKEQNL